GVVHTIERLLKVQEGYHGRWGVLLHVVQHVVEALDVRLDVALADETLLIVVDDVANMPLESVGQNACENLHVHVEQAHWTVVLRLRLGALLVQQYQCADKLHGCQMRTGVELLRKDQFQDQRPLVRGQFEDYKRQRVGARGGIGAAVAYGMVKFIRQQHDIPRSDLEGVWNLDSACTADVTGNKALFTKLAQTQLSALQLADNSTVQSMQLGLLSIQVDADHRLHRPKAKFVANLMKNFLTFRLLLRDGFQVAKWDLDVTIMILDTFVLKFTHHRGLYVLQPYEEHNLKTIMTDNAKEYKSKDLNAYCGGLGIEQLFTNLLTDWAKSAPMQMDLKDEAGQTQGPLGPKRVHAEVRHRLRGNFRTCAPNEGFAPDSCLVSRHGWKIRQMDVKTAFLNGVLDEQTKDLHGTATHETKVCKLVKSIYGRSKRLAVGT
ncbi:hypothetical protein AaE_015667, partial [Aphanomyces astaci]